MDTKFDTNVSNRVLLNGAKVSGLLLLPFFELLRENQLGRTPLNRIRVKAVYLRILTGKRNVK